MHAQTHGRTDNVKKVYPLQTKFAEGIIIKVKIMLTLIKQLDNILKLHTL